MNGEQDYRDAYWEYCRLWDVHEDDWEREHEQRTDASLRGWRAWRLRRTGYDEDE